MSVLASPHRARAAGAHPALMVWGAALSLLIAAIYATPLLKPVLSWAYDYPRGWIVPEMVLHQQPHVALLGQQRHAQPPVGCELLAHVFRQHTGGAIAGHELPDDVKVRAHAPRLCLQTLRLHEL